MGRLGVLEEATANSASSSGCGWLRPLATGEGVAPLLVWKPGYHSDGPPHPGGRCRLLPRVREVALGTGATAGST